MSKKIVFFGSGPVAAASLRLLAQDFSIEAVVTKPRPPHHRGAVPVLELAAELRLPVATVSNRKELDIFIAAKPYQSQVGVLIDFGIIVSQEVIDYFPLGIINSHFSLLPEWRGADPITFALLSGQKTTGVSLMMLVAAMDEGPLIAYAEQPLNDTSEPLTTPALTERLISLSHALLVQHLPRVLARQAAQLPQSITGRQVSYSRKLTKEDGIIDWQKAAVQLEREVRAFLDWPKSRTTLGSHDIVITKSHVLPESGPLGTITIVDKQLGVFCGTDMLIIDRLKPAGKQEMSSEAFLAGYKASLPLQ